MTHPVFLKLESFETLSDDDKALIDEVIATEHRIDRHTDIIRDGDRPDAVHLITKGFACRYKTLVNGKRQIVAILLPGDFCNHNAYVLDAMDHSIATLAPSRVAKISRQTMGELMSRPAIATALLQSAQVDGAILREWIANIGARKAEQRVAHFFCELHARMHAVGLARRDGTVTIPMTQVDLSEALGLSIVHTNRSIMKLKEKGLLTHKSGVLTILDTDALTILCGFTSNYLYLAKDRSLDQRSLVVN